MKVKIEVKVKGSEKVIKQVIEMIEAIDGVTVEEGMKIIEN